MYFKTRKEARIYQHITGMKWWTGAMDWESNAEIMCSKRMITGTA